MTEEYDVFGELDALCNDKFENFKNTATVAAAPSQNNKSDDDFDFSDDLFDASTAAGSKYTKQDSSEDLNSLLELGNSKTKKKKGRKTISSEENTHPSLGYGFSSSVQAKRDSPLKKTSTAKHAAPATQDLSSPIQDLPTLAQDVLSKTQYLLSSTQELPSPTIEPATPLRRLTRSMGRLGSSTEEQPSRNEPPVMVVPEIAVPEEVAQSLSTRGRRNTRGRKRKTQTPTQMENQLFTQTLAQTFNHAVAVLSGRTRQNRIQQMYSRREYAALMAAQSSNVAYVDLVSSPVPKIHGVINVDSDTEEKTETTRDSTKTNPESLETNASLDLSFDEENPEISVKVIWNGNPETFKLRKYQKFATMFATIAQREETDEKNLVFNINNKILSANDTPASINYKIFQFINGRVLVSKFHSPIINEKKKRDANKISLKIQSDQWKRPMQVELLKTEKFKILYIKCAEELNIPYENLKLSFDGESLEFDDTPADLELEGGEAIDLRVKK